MSVNHMELNSNVTKIRITPFDDPMGLSGRFLNFDKYFPSTVTIPLVSVATKIDVAMALFADEARSTILTTDHQGKYL